MAWGNLAGAAPGQEGDTPAAMSLLTLSLHQGACRKEIDFYAEAEHSALLEWSRGGYILLALHAMDVDEMLIVCPYDRAVIQPMAAMLPYVVADLASFQVRTVSPANFIHRR